MTTFEDVKKMAAAVRDKVIISKEKTKELLAFLESQLNTDTDTDSTDCRYNVDGTCRLPLPEHLDRALKDDDPDAAVWEKEINVAVELLSTGFRQGGMLFTCGRLSDSSDVWDQLVSDSVLNEIKAAAVIPAFIQDGFTEQFASKLKADLPVIPLGAARAAISKCNGDRDDEDEDPYCYAQELFSFIYNRPKEKVNHVLWTFTDEEINADVLNAVKLANVFKIPVIAFTGNKRMSGMGVHVDVEITEYGEVYTGLYEHAGVRGRICRAVKKLLFEGEQPGVMSSAREISDSAICVNCPHRTPGRRKDAFV